MKRKKKEILQNSSYNFIDTFLEESKDHLADDHLDARDILQLTESRKQYMSPFVDTSIKVVMCH